MTINYDVKAEVVDIRNDVPNSNDVFFVDTNILYWMSYTKFSQGIMRPRAKQVTTYPNYIKNAITNGAKLTRCCLSFPEISHLIEKTEREIFEKTKIRRQVDKKEFRHNFQTERKCVVAEINTAWEQVKTISESMDITINDAITDSAMNNMAEFHLDGYDYFYYQALCQKKIFNILSDDGDYSTIPNTCIFTANEGVIQAASAKGKLVIRPTMQSAV